MSALRKSFLNGAAVAVLLATSGVAYAGDPGQPAAGNGFADLKWEGAAEFGGQGFIEKPGNTPGNSSAKFNQYGDRTDPVFLTMFNFGLYNPDGSLRIDGFGKNVGTNQQAYDFDVIQPGQQYFDYTWSSVPNLRSNTAMTIFQGVGTNNLTVPSSVVQQLYHGIWNSTSATPNYTTNSPANSYSGASPYKVTNQVTGAATAYQPFGCYLPGQPQCVAGVTPVQTTILNNEKPLTLGIQRDRQDAEYKWTPDAAWTIKVDYSHDHRTGVQEQGFLFSSSTSTPMAQVPMPVDDTTDDASISAEYFGISPWGMKWNGMIKYDLSLYRDAFTQYSVENPFGGPGSPAAGVPQCPVASSTTPNNCYGMGAMDTAPDNSANTIMAQAGVDLPGFKSNRFMTTVQFSDMRQNAAFTAETINPGVNGLFALKTGTAQLAAVPRSSLDGDIQTFLSNNVLSTQLNSEVKNKLSYRYYSYDNDTPALTLANWLVNDAAIATSNAATSAVGSGAYAPHTTLFSSYVKQNAADEVTWTPASWGMFGVGGGWEGYQYSQYPVDATNEFSGKVFTRLTPTDWLVVRATENLASRRYDNYNWQNYIGSVMLAGVTATGGLAENPALVDYNVANRDRNTGNIYIDITTPVGLTITPNAGYRWDNFPSDPNLAVPGQLGLQYDHAANYGLELDWAASSTLSFLGSFTHDSDNMDLMGSSSSTLPLAAAYISQMHEHGNTFIVGMNYQIIPDKLSLKLAGTMALFKDDWDTGAVPGFCGTGSGANCGIVSPGNPAYPPESTNFNRFDATLAYKVNSTFANQLQLKDMVFKLHWAYEKNSVTNWQLDSASPYLYSVLNSSTTAMRDMIFLAGDNPNYTAQLISLSAVIKW